MAARLGARVFKKGDVVLRYTGGSYQDVREGEEYIVDRLEGHELYLIGHTMPVTPSYFRFVRKPDRVTRAEQLTLIAEKEDLLRQTQEAIAKAKALLAELDAAPPEPGDTFFYKSFGKNVTIRSVVEGHVWMRRADGGDDYGFIRPMADFKGKATEFSRVS